MIFNKRADFALAQIRARLQCAFDIEEVREQGLLTLDRAAGDEANRSALPAFIEQGNGASALLAIDFNDELLRYAGEISVSAAVVSLASNVNAWRAINFAPTP